MGDSRWRWLMPPLFVSGIAVLAGALQEPALLFPELGALATVVLRQPEAPWSKAPLQLVIAPLLTACIGELCLLLIPQWPLTVLLSVGLSIALVRWLRSPIVPALSCGLAAWCFQLKSWSFPLALLLGTGVLAMICVLRAAPGGLDRQPGEGAPPETGLAQWLPGYGLLLGLGLLLVALTGERLILFPPLMVMAYELLVHPHSCPWRGRPCGMVLGCTLAAAAGTWLASGSGALKPLAVALAMVLVELLQRGLGFRMLPAFGVALIPFLPLNDRPSYPLCVALGTALLAVVAWLMQKQQRQ